MRLGVIGYGKRMRHIVEMVRRTDDSCRVAAIADPRHAQIRDELGREAGAIRLYEQAEDMLDSALLDGILIGTRCHTHADFAIRSLPKGIPLFLEKPVATTMADLLRLKQAYETVGHKRIVVSFPLRVTPIVQKVKEIVDSGAIGAVEHVQALTNVTYGGNYFHNWMRDDSLTGGLFLQKATHDLDYINYVLGFKPVRLCAMGSKQVFKGVKPAGLTCVECDEREECPESQAALGPDAHVRWCCFAEDTGNEDSGSILIKYETGMHVSYSQNFLVRREAGSRGARFIGYKGTVEFDFYTKQVTVHPHHAPGSKTYTIVPETGHHGGDQQLVNNFIDLVKGKTETSVSGLEDGLLSALMCLKAKASAETETFEDVSWPTTVPNEAIAGNG